MVRRLHMRRWLLRAVLAAVALLLLTVGWYAARVWYLRDHDPELTAFMAQRLAVLRSRDPDAVLYQSWVSYERIAPALRRALIAAEDARFMEHAGFDWAGIESALRRNLREGEVVAGGSTISQQLAKNLFLSGDRSLLRKGQEAVLTVLIEAILSKRRIYELYLNVIEWGDGVYGAEAAARHYFRVGAGALDARQAALLAAMVPRPRYYHGRGFTPQLYRRAVRIRDGMEQVRVP